jgi:hypothetical protein
MMMKRLTMKYRTLLALALLLALLGGGLGVRPTHADGPVTIPLIKGGSSSFASAPYASDLGSPDDQFDEAVMGDADGSGGDDADEGINRTLPGAVTGNGRPVNPNKRAKSNPELGTHFAGLNFHDQRYANGGQQFAVEPPDQALCAGNGFVLEVVNDVLQIHDRAGHPLLNGGQAVDLNTFYGYPAQIDRSTFSLGPSISDPVCLYDQAIGRFVLVVLTMDRVGTTPALNGNNHLDIAVSNSGDPTASWTIYRLPMQNNGTQGTPDHHCNRGFCFGDYPHIGADANGIYLTTNEYAFFGPNFYAAQVYAIGHQALLGGSGSVVLFNTAGLSPDGRGFTVWPAQTTGGQYNVDHGGTEYLLSSDAVFSVTGFGASNRILLWTLTNTSSLNSAAPAANLNVQTVSVEHYAAPPRAKQKPGSLPLQQCLADTVTNCWFNFANTPNPATFGTLNANDSRFGQVAYANGKVWGALGTAVTVGSSTRAGIAYYIVNPNSASIVLQGQAGLPGTDLTYASVGVLPNGRGVLSFTLTGDDDYPSAAYAALDAALGMGDVHIIAAGVGPWDGFTSYRVFSTRPRWGDYGATAVDGSTIWIGSEYIAQTCTYAQFLAQPFGQCGGTRNALGNWATHISQITP